MNKRKVIGIILISLAIILSLANVLSVKITGGVVGINIESSVLTILTIAFFVMGLLFLSRVGKGLAALLLVGGSIVGGHKLVDYARDSSYSKQFENVKGIDGNFDVQRKAVKYQDTNIGNYQTIQQTKNIPAIIVESFYGTNENDLKYFMNKKNRKKFGDNVANGIDKYVKSDPNIKMITIAGGHGKNDPGALFGPKENIHESDFNKEISKYVADRLKQKGHKVQYLWYADSGGQRDRLNKYVDKANKYSGKSVYVEIHADAAGKNVAGSKVFIPKPKNKNPKSDKFGKIVLNEINKSW